MDKAQIQNIISSKFIRSGKNMLGLCPFHEEATPSCVYNPDKDTFHCFGCLEKGDGEKLAYALQD